jgi:hypothetical protein
MPMHEPVRHAFHSKLLSSLRLPSFAGTGLPERMRSISFALLGLTAAAGLALVAIFAQPGFQILSPAPLPDEPSAGQAVAKARRLSTAPAPVALTAARPVPAGHGTNGSLGGSAPGNALGPAGDGTTGEGAESHLAPAEVDVPAAAVTPGPAAGTGGGAGTGNGGGSTPAPIAAPEQPVSAPSTPAGALPPAAPKPEPIAAAPKPEPAPAPGNSDSAAAAEHASERGIEASSGAGPAAGAAAAPESAAPPGNGNGLAKGHDK